MGCGMSKEKAAKPLPPSAKYINAQPQLSHGVLGQFPKTFQFYYTGQHTLNKASYFVIAADYDTQLPQPIYAVKFRMGNTETSSSVRLYSGIDRTSTAMGSSGLDHWNDPYSFISLPAPATGAHANRVERFMHVKGMDRHSFSLAVPREDGSLQEEVFEWRGSSMLLASKTNIKPWTLFRLASGGREETVATWTELEQIPDSGKLGTFSFCGSGATGELGQYWALMVVMSFLDVYYSRYVLNKFVGQLVGSNGLLFKGLGLAL